MIRLLFGALILGLDIWAILNVFKSRSSDGAKIGWLVGILVFPIVGFLVWLFVGPRDNLRLPPR